MENSLYSLSERHCRKLENGLKTIVIALTLGHSLVGGVCWTHLRNAVSVCGLQVPDLRV